MINAKPFLKWAGGKTQIISDLEDRLTTFIKHTKEIDCYVEPFVGGGAFFFYLKSNYKIKKAYLFDANKELIVGYKVIQKEPEKIIKKLKIIENEYLPQKFEDKKKYYYEIREKYNEQRFNFDYNNFNNDWIERAAFLIFLNKTCFNGLFRLNKKGGFNVPHGSYKNPTIYNMNNLLKINKALKNTKIILGDFTKSEKYISSKSVVYFDPPYRPLNGTSSFTSYSVDGFTDDDQKRLSDFYSEMSQTGAFLILSNSDPQNENPDDDFFTTLYSNFYIDKVAATRMINCNGNRRGKINELIITNYEEEVAAL